MTKRRRSIIEGAAKVFKGLKSYNDNILLETHARQLNHELTDLMNAICGHDVSEKSYHDFQSSVKGYSEGHQCLASNPREEWENFFHILDGACECLCRENHGDYCTEILQSLNKLREKWNTKDVFLKDNVMTSVYAEVIRPKPQEFIDMIVASHTIKQLRVKLVTSKRGVLLTEQLTGYSNQPKAG